MATSLHSITYEGTINITRTFDMKDTHTSVVRATQAVQPAGTTIFIVQVRRLAEVIFWDTVYMDAATRIARLHVF